MLYGIVAATTALLLAAVLAALLRAPTLRLGLLDRRQRQRRVPLCGGAAVVLATCLVVVAGDRTGFAPLGEGMGALLAAGAGVAALGLVADAWRLKTRFLLVGTAVAAAFVVPYGDTGVLAGVAAVGWIACVALAFRALDHADGVAGTVGVVTAFGVAACAAAEVMDGLAVLLSVLAAALTGFLMHNWPPARVALGGCGAMFTGFLLAVAAVTTRAGQDATTGAGVLFALTAVAVADAALVVLARRTSGRPLLRRGPDHLAHRLRRLGLTPAGVTVTVGAAAFAGVLVGTLVHTGLLGARAVLWVAGGVVVVVLVLWRVRPRVPGQARGRRRPDVRVSREVRTSHDARVGQDARGGHEVRASREDSPRHRVRSRRRSGTLVQRPRESTESAEPVESPLRASPRMPSSQVSGSLRVRNG